MGRKLKKDELVREMEYRLAIRGIKGRLPSELVHLVAEMIDLSQQEVPACYDQGRAINVPVPLYSDAG